MGTVASEVCINLNTRDCVTIVTTHWMYGDCGTPDSGIQFNTCDCDTRRTHCCVGTVAQEVCVCSLIHVTVNP